MTSQPFDRKIVYKLVQPNDKESRTFWNSINPGLISRIERLDAVDSVFCRVKRLRNLSQRSQTG